MNHQPTYSTSEAGSGVTLMVHHLAPAFIFSRKTNMEANLPSKGSSNGDAQAVPPIGTSTNDSPASGNGPASGTRMKKPGKRGPVSYDKLTPKELYDRHFGGSGLSGKDLGQVQFNSEPFELPEKLVTYLKRLYKGALKRRASLKVQIARFRRIIHDRYETRTDVNGIERKVAIAESDWLGYRAKLLRAKAQLIEVEQDCAKYQQFHEEALEQNAEFFRTQISSAKEEAYAKRMTPSLTKQVIAALDKAGSNGQAAKVAKLRDLAQPGKREEFRVAFMDLIGSLDRDLETEFHNRPKLLTKVIGRVVDHFAEPAV